MNHFSKLTITALVTTFLFACSNKNDANEKNFLTALKQHYQNSNLCFEEATPFVVLKFNKIPSFQRDFVRQLSEDPTSNFGRIIGLEKAGLIKKSNDSSTTYELTETGIKYSTETKIHRPFQDEKDARKFCWGKIEPSQIVNWDIPSSNTSPLRTVTYKYKVADIAPWVNEKSIKKSYPQIGNVLEMQDKKEIKQTLKLTNTGWEVLE